MVRFSDIIRSKGKRAGEKKQPGATGREEGFRLSDSSFFKPRSLDTSPGRKRPARKISTAEAGSYYRAFTARARETGDLVKNDMQISPAAILSDLHEVVDRDMVDGLYEYAMSVNNEQDDIFTHAAAVTFTSLKIGKGMNYDNKMMLKLGLAAFLENVGMYKIPEHKLSIKGKLSKNEIALIRKHPETSYDLLSNLGDRYKWLAETALSVHERADGSGYPSGLKMDKIPELSAVIGLADIYCAMIKKRPYRKKFMPADAVKSIIHGDRGKFPSKIVKVFLDQISLFPVGSCVKLSNGSVGKVLTTNRRHPLSPTVGLLSDSEGKKTEDIPEIALTDDPLLYIEKSIDPDEPGE